MKDLNKVPLNIAKVTLCNLELVSKLTSQVVINGCIGSIAVMKLANCGNKLQKNVFMVGGRATDEPVSPTGFEPVKAFTFDMQKTSSKAGEKEATTVNIHMASAYYIHNPHLLREIVLYIGDYKQYALNLAKSIQLAASDMAKSMVMKRRSVPVISSSSQEFSPISAGRDSSPDSLSWPEQFSSAASSTSTPSKTYFTVNIETPVVVFPRDDDSLEFVVGHLGKIHVNNNMSADDTNQFPTNPTKTSSLNNVSSEKLVVEIEKINLSVLHGTTDGSCAESEDIIYMLRKQEHSHIAILHNTDLYLQIEKIFTNRFQQQSSSFQQPRNQQQTIKILGQINTTLRLFLSVPIYQQILATLKYSTNISSNAPPTSATPIPTTLSNSSLSVDEIPNTCVFIVISKCLSYLTSLARLHAKSKLLQILLPFHQPL